MLSSSSISPPTRIFYRLDNWEDDSRRRRRLVVNPFGSSHPEAVLHSPAPPLSAPSPQPPPLAVDSGALNLRPQSEEQSRKEEEEFIAGTEERNMRKASVESSLQPPPTPSSASIPASPLILTEPGLAFGIASAHQDAFAFGQLEPSLNGEFDHHFSLFQSI